jgi:hypothetical protein
MKKQKVGSESSKNKSTSEKVDEKQLTFNLLPLRLESLARLLAPSLQVSDGGLLLLEGLAQVLVRDAKLDQLPIEPRDLVLPLLEGGLRVVWTSLGPLPRWVPGSTTRWAPGTTRLVPHGT